MIWGHESVWHFAWQFNDRNIIRPSDVKRRAVSVIINEFHSWFQIYQTSQNSHFWCLFSTRYDMVLKLNRQTVLKSGAGNAMITSTRPLIIPNVKPSGQASSKRYFKRMLWAMLQCLFLKIYLFLSIQL